MYPLGIVYAAVILGVQSTTENGARGCVADSDKRGVDGVERPPPTLCQALGRSGPAEGAMTNPSACFRRHPFHALRVNTPVMRAAAHL